MSAEFDLKKWIGEMCESGFSTATIISLAYNKGQEQAAKQIEAIKREYFEAGALRERWEDLAKFDSVEEYERAKAKLKESK